ncbi:DUF1294 domain-containing protein [Actibacterium lipolyticum]|uniref:DUF1294 domain-containing protein n=1 Tax=Actibacterium lipolyticum TaxID=1524263 RepID=A0A238KVE9_9RHOB|nr:DUF1294 domain-containing protein [Actibacterium lipolyticum]SMX46749.1 hypothetical protein COL8621_03236 [Actibacterium lipolyticum]
MPETLEPFAWLVIVLPYLFCVNLITYLLFAWDKHRAANGGWRIRESTLLIWSFVGGSPSAKLAQKVLRHKTRKQPFRTVLNLIVLGQVVALMSLFHPQIRSTVGAGLNGLAQFAVRYLG